MVSADNESLVYVIDNELQARTVLKRLLESVGFDCQVFASVAEFSHRSEKVCCLILDVRLPERDGFALQAELARSHPTIPIIVTCAHANMRMAVNAIKGGAADFFSKPYREQDLLDAVQRALVRAHGDRQVEMKMRGLLERYDTLSKREKQVMHLVCRGLSNRQIAHAMVIAEVTVKRHRQGVIRKLKVESIPALVRIADAIEARRHGN